MFFSTNDEAKLEADLVERFVRYARITTTSDPSATTKPTTETQIKLLKELHGELAILHPDYLESLSEGYVLARFEATSDAVDAPCFALLAHVDTSPDAPGDSVRPLVHELYEGGPIRLPGGPILEPEENPELARYIGKTIITSDGSTLLGADDKAGVAEIMAAVTWLRSHPEISHGPFEIVFTTDEEVGRGTEKFPFAKLKSKFAYTLDGSEEGGVEAECYNASHSYVRFFGKSHHPGTARGRLVNAVTMAASFVAQLPRNESPEATDGRFGCLWANRISGGVENAEIDVFCRDFDPILLQRRIDSLAFYAKAVEAAFPGGKVEIETSLQYRNMKEGLAQRPEVLEKLFEAVKAAGCEPFAQSIRGGTDGARLTEKGLPTPNLFTGGMNYHSRTEWVAVPAMVSAAKTVLELIGLWARA